MEPVDLAREREHRLAAERDDDGARRERAQRRAPTNSSGSIRSKTLHLGVGERVQDERLRVERAEQEDVAVLAREQKPRPGRAALRVVGPLHLVEHEHLAGAGAISTVQQMIGAWSLIALLAGDEADRSSPSSAESRRCASCASIRSGPA